MSITFRHIDRVGVAKFIRRTGQIRDNEAYSGNQSPGCRSDLAARADPDLLESLCDPA